MCGRFIITSLASEFVELLGVEHVSQEIEPHYNLTPQHFVPVIADTIQGRRLGQMKWGLIPPWARDESFASKMINARSETLDQKKSFRKPFEFQRCLILANGFYEWKKKETGPKQPYFISLKSGDPLMFAGLYEVWKAPSGDRISTCTIITTQPNSLMKPLHHRMPVILDKNDCAMWLDREYHDTDSLKTLLVRYSADKMKTHKVSLKVNSPENNDETLIRPL